MDNEDKKRIQDEKARIKARRAEGSKVVDPLIKVEFQNIEDPPTPGSPSPPFEFTFQLPSNQIISFRVSRSEEIQDTALRHGETYELPLSVVNHLNEVRSPVYGQKIIPDPVTGAQKIINYIVTYRKRFACVPIDMGSVPTVKDAKKRKRDTSPSKTSEKDDTNRELAGLSN